jgi:hypothetical protein
MMIEESSIYKQKENSNPISTACRNYRDYDDTLKCNIWNQRCFGSAQIADGPLLHNAGQQVGINRQQGGHQPAAGWASTGSRVGINRQHLQTLQRQHFRLKYQLWQRNNLAPT